jgi:hypothetical protein
MGVLGRNAWRRAYIAGEHARSRGDRGARASATPRRHGGRGDELRAARSYVLEHARSGVGGWQHDSALLLVGFETFGPL